MEIAILAIPFIINALAVWQWRGGCRYGPLPFLVMGFAADLNGTIQRGKRERASCVRRQPSGSSEL